MDVLTSYDTNREIVLSHLDAHVVLHWCIVLVKQVAKR
jgi:hypothetical protein